MIKLIIIKLMIKLIKLMNTEYDWGARWEEGKGTTDVMQMSIATKAAINGTKGEIL